MPKTVHVILAFHAHEPLWDLPAHLQSAVPDMRIAQAVPPENYLRRRAKEGRNIYRDLIAFASGMGVRVTVDISNDLLHQIRTILPRTFEELRRAYRDRTIYPLYTTAHHTHAVLLEPGELVEWRFHGVALFWTRAATVTSRMCAAALEGRTIYSGPTLA